LQNSVFMDMPQNPILIALGTHFSQRAGRWRRRCSTNPWRG
jgi:hypothetical protein